jgi:MoaA/NifB/PqqE/SkfB family radical SAM enzyme
MAVLDHVYQKAGMARIPLEVHFDLTYRCHQHCIHCYLPESWRQGKGPGPDLDTAQVKAILDQLAEAGTFFLTFSGGEIFLRPDLMHLVEFARGLNFSVSLLASGSLGPDAEQVEKLAQIGIDSLTVSLYSLEAAVHDRITRRPGSWTQVMRTIESCQTQGLKVFLTCVILSANAAGVDAVKQFSHRLGLPLRASGGLVPRWDGRSYPLGLEPDSPEAPPEQREYSQASVSSPEVPSKYCGAGLNCCYISPQGEVWPCVDLPCPGGSMGRGKSFAAVWKGSRVLNQVRRLMDRGWEQDGKLCHLYRQHGIKIIKEMLHG